MKGFSASTTGAAMPDASFGIFWALQETAIHPATPVNKSRVGLQKREKLFIIV
jgi:hypothetical protein